MAEGKGGNGYVIACLAVIAGIVGLMIACAAGWIPSLGIRVRLY